MKTIGKRMNRSGDLNFKLIDLKMVFFREGNEYPYIFSWSLCSVWFWNVGGVSSCEPNLFTRKQRSSDLKSPELTFRRKNVKEPLYRKWQDQAHGTEQV
jgi:hypothetical protein